MTARTASVRRDTDETRITLAIDLDGTGRVSQQEFLRPGDGLADAIIASRAS